MRVLFNGLGRYGEALVSAQQASDVARELHISHWALAELVEACVRSGNSDLAAEALGRLVEATSASDAEWGLGIVARSRALDLWREKQAAGRAEDRLKVVVGIGGEESLDADPAPRAIASERAEAVRDALRVLPDAQREAVELALQLRDHQRNSFGSTCSGRDDVEGGSAGAAEVLVRVVQYHLVVRIRVDGCHEALLDAEVAQDHLGDRR